MLFACGCKGGGATSGPPGPLDAGPPPMAALSFAIDPGLACADGGIGAICVAPSQTVTFRIDGTLDGTVVSLSLQGELRRRRAHGGPGRHAHRAARRRDARGRVDDRAPSRSSRASGSAASAQSGLVPVTW